MSAIIFLSVFVAVILLSINFIGKAYLCDVLKGLRYNFNYYGIATLSNFADILHRNENVLKGIPSRKGEVAVVTGGARGIGLAVSKGLAKAGYHVIVGVRNVDKGDKLAEELIAEKVPGSIEPIQLNVSSMRSVRKFAQTVKSKYPEVHLLVNNAGIIFGDFRLTDEGFEAQLATNYMGHFLLTHLLLNNLKNSSKKSERFGRVVNVASCAHYGSEIQFDDINLMNSYHPTLGYARSKLAQLMFTRHLNRLLTNDGTPVRIYAAHPGIVGSDMLTQTPETRLLGPLKKLFKTIEEGSISVLYCCFAPELENPGGNYISNCKEGYSTAYSKDKTKQNELFKVSCELLRIKNFGIE